MENQNNPNTYGSLQQQDPNRSKAIASMVLGIVSLVFLWFGWGSLVAIVTAIVGLVIATQVRKAPPGPSIGMANAGFVMCIIALALSAFVFVACVLCVSAIGTAGLMY